MPLSREKLDLLKHCFMVEAMTPGQAAKRVGVTYATPNRYYEKWSSEIRRRNTSRARAQYLNPSTNVFAAPATGTPAPNHGQANIVGPPTWQWDASLARTFNVREGHRVEFRVEAYNVTNSFRPRNPNTTFTSGDFGRIVTAGLSRDIQFATRYLFQFDSDTSRMLKNGDSPGSAKHFGQQNHRDSRHINGTVPIFQHPARFWEVPGSIIAGDFIFLRRFSIRWNRLADVYGAIQIAADREQTSYINDQNKQYGLEEMKTAG
jgi:hypothetical protein